MSVLTSKQHCVMQKLLKIFAIAALLMVMPTRQFGQVIQAPNDETTISFDITDISLFDERIFFTYSLLNDGRFNVVPSERDGIFIISADPTYKDMPLQSAFNDFREQNAIQFSKMDKEQASETAMAYKGTLSNELVASMMMDYYIQSRQNNLCASADPFCTDNGMYEFPAGVNAGSGESGPDYACLSTTPNPAWYYMRIGTPGNINIYMYSTPGEDIDFCCWGPFSDPVSPCPNGLTLSKRVSCSYSPSPTENCVIPASAQTGDYFILVITNFSNQQCNINFSKTSGSGTTDCGILPPLVNNEGPYCVGETIQLTANGQSGASYSWTGPNGYTSNQQNPTRPNCTMAMAGTYTCTISLNGQTNNAPTQVQVYAKPTANFTATSVCLGETTHFTNTSTTSPSGQTMSYLWNFGDGQTSTQQNPTHQYATSGNKTVTLTTSCGQGTCTSTKTLNVNVYPNPTANAGADQTTQYGGSVTLNGSGGTGTFNYHWEPADKVTNPNSASTQTVGLTESTTFTLTATHPQGGCSSTDQMTVLIEGSNMTATASVSPSAVCLGESAQLQATAVGGNPNGYSYSWSPSLGLSDPLSANPSATPNETTTYTCTVSDGYTTQQVSTTLTVNNPEYEEVTEYICPGESFNFYGTEYSEEGDFPYETTTAQGCEKVITLHLHHYPTYENAHTTTEYICPGTSYLFHGQYYSTSGLHPATLETVHGCDSVVWLDLTVYPANDTTLVDQAICTSQVFNFHGVDYNTDTIVYFDTLDNHGCLKVEKLKLEVGPYQMPPTQKQYECVPYDGEPYYYWDKTEQAYTEDTYDEIILPDPQGGCDIKYRLDLKFHREFFQTDTLTVCDSYHWPVDPGSNYTTTDHHIVKTFPIGGGPNFNCDSIYVLDLTVNHSDDSTTTVLDQCDQYEWQFGWNGETYVYNEQGIYTQQIETVLGCDSVGTLNLQLDYSPDFERVEGKPWVVGGSEFQYTIERYWIETHPNSTHTTTWNLYDKNGEEFKKWEVVPYDNGDKCMVYIYTFERDSIEIRAHTQSSGECDCGEYTKSKWIHCGYYDVDEVTSLCEADIFPNPNDGNMTLSFDNMTGEIEVKVYSMTGALVDQLTLYNGLSHQAHSYNPGKLTPGVYFFSFTSKEGLLTKKVIIFD